MIDNRKTQRYLQLLAVSMNYQIKQSGQLVKYWHVVLIVFATILGIGGLILEYGFVRPNPTTHLPITTPPISVSILHAAEYLAIACFILALWSKQIFIPNRWEFFKEHLLELMLSILAIAGLIVTLSSRFNIPQMYQRGIDTALTIYLVLQLMIVFVKLNTWFIQSMLHPARAVLVGFTMLILVGAFLLSLPCSSYSDSFPDFGHNFVENLFTATSAVCVTGLIVRDTGKAYTPFGQLVIMILIQLGGLGIVIFGTIFALLVGRQISLREASVVQDIYNQQALGQIREIVKFVVFSTLTIEAIGAALMLPLWSTSTNNYPEQIFKSLFHSISAFCNAGFALQTDNMIKFANAWQTYLVMLPLIIIGGLGFPVLLNIAQIIKHRFVSLIGLDNRGKDLDRFRVVSLTLHSKIVLITTAVLIVVGTLAIFLCEQPRENLRWGRKVELEDKVVKSNPAVMTQHSTDQRLLDSLFLSVSARTAGFNTVDTSSGKLHPATDLILIVLMFIGGSPASTAGGIKTVTFALLLATVVTTLRRRSKVEMFKRTIDTPIIRRAIALVVLFFVLVWLTSLALVIVQPQINYLDLLFESASACGTVGYSMGVTPQLNLAGRLIIILAMFAGRLGPLTLLFAIARSSTTIRYEYPRESVITG